MISGSDDHTVKLVYLLPINTSYTGFFGVFTIYLYKHAC